MNISPKKDITLTRTCKECGAPHSFTFQPGIWYKVTPDAWGYEGIHAVYPPSPHNGRYTLHSDDWQLDSWGDEFPDWILEAEEGEV